MTVFSKQWFKKYNKQLCWLANSFIGQFIFKFRKFGHCLDPNKKITKITPNSVAQYNGLVYKEKTGEKITYKIIKEVECHNDKCEYCNFHDAEYGEYPDDCKDKDCIKGHTIKKTRIKIVTPIYTKLKTPKEEYTEHFFSRNEYALRLQKIFYPIWLTFHTWDMLIANRFKPAWNLGFDTLTVYPDADPESTSVDGYAFRVSDNSSWASLIAGAGVAGNHNGALIAIWFQAGSSSDWQTLGRGILLFDTSALTADVTISAAVLSATGYAKSDGNSATPDIDVYTSTPNTNTTIIASDFSQLGSTSQTGSPITYAGFSIAGYNDFTLNATGRGNVSKTSISKFGLRNANYDVAEIEPNRGGSETESYMYMRSADYGSVKPKLVVTYTSTVDYEMVAALGTFTLTGIAALLKRGYTLACNLGTFISTGIAVGLTSARNIIASAGSFVLTGVTTGLTSTRSMIASLGTFTLTGIDTLFSRGKTLIADVGVFTLTGIGATLTSTRSMIASAGSFTLTGIVTGLTSARSMIASTGSFILTGIAIGTCFARTIVASAGSFVLTGVATTFVYGKTLIASLGEFILNGIDVRLKRGWRKRIIKNVTTFTKQEKQTTNFTKQEKQTTNFSKQEKRESSWTKQPKP